MITFLAMLCVAFNASAQDSSAMAMVKKWVEAKAFTFEASTMTPSKGGMRQLTGVNYTVLVSGDTLNSDLT
jgi:hypothetical protein